MKGNNASKPLTKKTPVGVEVAEETPNLTGEFGWRDPQGPRKPPIQECPLLRNKQVKTKKKKKKVQIKVQKKYTKQWRDSQPIRCRVQNNGDQDTHRNDWAWPQNKGRSEIKENAQGTNSEGKETRTQIYNLEQKEEVNIQLEKNEQTRIQKNESRLRNL